MKGGKEILPTHEWKRREELHWTLIRPFTEAYRERKGRGENHPVYDFLFTYYTLSTAKLECWHPGYGVGIQIEPGSNHPLLAYSLYSSSDGVVAIDPEKVPARIIKQAQWVQSLCKAILERPMRFSCLGLHEWAMVYDLEDVRHDYPLRLSSAEIREVVSSSAIVCSHFDAFRFFSKNAGPLNILQPEPHTRLEHEQGGCLHANMDLYKWAYKLIPLVSSELLRETFFLAISARELDMRASPYDLSTLGFEPIRIESREGREEYIDAQRAIAARAEVLRLWLLRTTEQILLDVNDGSEHYPRYPEELLQTVE